MKDGIRPYRMGKRSKINRLYMYLYMALKSTGNFIQALNLIIIQLISNQFSKAYLIIYRFLH